MLAPMPAQDRDERHARILAVVDSIPRGHVASYGQVAHEAGLPRNARLVGRLLSGLPPKSTIPWFRVIQSGGTLAPRSGASLQRRLLKREGVHVSPTGRIDLTRFAWHPGDDEPSPRR